MRKYTTEHLESIVAFADYRLRWFQPEPSEEQWIQQWRAEAQAELLRRGRLAVA